MAKTLEFRGIGKSFPGVRALDNVNFIAEGGKVLALLGENGAGKSTLLKILSGDQPASEGEILVDGKATAFHSPHDSQAAGISVIYQERQLMPSLSVMENLYAGALPKGKLGLVDKNKLYAETQKIINEFGLDIDPAEEVGRLSIANQQMVEIMKAYRRDSYIIAYDEPTAPLSEKEIELMFKVIEKQKAAGKAIIYVSHRMNEIFRITDEIVVLKDGRQVTTLKTKETSEPELIKAMVGRDIGDTYANLRRNTPQKEVLLEVRNLSTPKLKMPVYIKDIIKANGSTYEEVHTLEEAIGKLDVLYMTRIQQERFDSEEEYLAQKNTYVLDKKKMQLARQDMIVMHPLPRVDEITVEVDEDPRALYFTLAKYGVFARMALIMMILSDKKSSETLKGKIYGGVRCDNPRCITNHEEYLPKSFRSGGDETLLECEYCDERKLI